MAFLIDEKGQLIVYTDQKLLAGKPRTNLSHYSPVKALLAGKSSAFYFTEKQGIKWLSHLKKLDSGWVVVILQQEEEALEKVHLFWHLAMTITVIAILVADSLT
ncbi:MAG: hypothetical protein ABI180_17020 [Microcoleus sp.]